MLLTKSEIEKAVGQGLEVKKKYPEFYKMHEMIITLHKNLNVSYLAEMVTELEEEKKNDK